MELDWIWDVWKKGKMMEESEGSEVWGGRSGRGRGGDERKR